MQTSNYRSTEVVGTLEDKYHKALHLLLTNDLVQQFKIKSVRLTHIVPDNHNNLFSDEVRADAVVSVRISTRSDEQGAESAMKRKNSPKGWDSVES